MALLLSAVGTTAVFESASSQASTRVADPPSVAVPAGWHVSPLSYFLVGDGITPALQSQYQYTLVSCMNARGWTGAPVAATLQVSPPTSTVGSREAYAARVGYGSTTSAASGATAAATMKQATVAYLSTLSAADRQRYLYDLDGGDSDTAVPGPAASQGCEPQTWLSVTSGLPVNVPAVRKAYGAALNTVAGLPVMQAANANWAACMANNGHPKMKDPGSLEATFSSPTPPSISQPAEIATASADYSCQDATITPVRHAAEMSEVQKLAAEFPQFAGRAQP